MSCDRRAIRSTGLRASSWNRDSAMNRIRGLGRGGIFERRRHAAAPVHESVRPHRAKADFVHETTHARHTDAIAGRQGGAFSREWNHLRGDPDRKDKLRPAFPTQVANFDSQWNSGHDWARDEVHSYLWQRRFLVDTLAALNRICP